MFTFGKKTIDSVLSSFQQTVSDLQALATEHTNENKRHQDLLQYHAEQATQHLAESQRALSIAGKIESIIT